MQDLSLQAVIPSWIDMSLFPDYRIAQSNLNSSMRRALGNGNDEAGDPQSVPLERWGREARIGVAG